MTAIVTGWSVGIDGTPGPVLRTCLEAAIAAPSIHNSQPWRFRATAEGVDVLADHSRRLRVVDPHGRELTMSLGAAILNLRIAIAAHGRAPVLRVFPEPADRNLVARVVPATVAHPTETVRALARAIPKRRTNRRPFADVTVPDDVLVELCGAAAAEGATLAVVGDEGRRAVLDLVRSAEARFRNDHDYWFELADWTFATPERLDGVPREAFGPWSAGECLPLRDFGLIQPGRRRRVEQFEPAPTLAVLSTPGNDPVEWLRAGQALERVLLTATVRGLSSTPMSQPVEIEELRGMLSPAAGGVAQAVLRFGYGPPCPPSPRRPLDEVLILH